MKKLHALPLPTLILLSFINTSCQKSHTTPNSPVDSIPKATMSINLTIPGDTSIKQSELIISEPGGKILLDTVTGPATDVITILHTDATLVNLTLVRSPDSRGTYNITTFNAVNPSSWTYPVTTGDYAYLPPPSPTRQAQLQYTNVPITTNFFFSNGINNNVGMSYNPATHSASVNYQQEPGDYAYLLLSDLGLYSMHVPTGLSDTVDCTHLDTAGTATLNTVSSYTFNTCVLWGMPDSNSPDRSLYLYENPYGSPGVVQYPKKYIQKFMLENIWTGTAYETVYSYNYGDTIARNNYNLPAPGAYTINSNQNNQFSVQFNSVKPCYYETQWGSTGLFWQLYANPDSTAMNPIALLQAQKSKLLQGIDLTAMTHQYFQYENIPGYKYADYLNLTCNPTLKRTKRIASSVYYSNKF